MKLSKSLIAGMGILLLGVTPLLQAAPGPDDQHGQPQQQQQGHGEQHGQQGGQQQKQGNGRPPQDFGPVRQTIQSNHADFGRGNPLPANVHVQKGHPLPKGYGKRLDSRALAHMPQYKGYEWRRLGNDVVLISVANGVVYEILSGVLN
ncbi:MAG: anti-virulence regulator CigR family protein [Pseudomonas sp.]|uniref:anti-virulence regulator CigR family protein n=1 Tax=Pseudomonas abieticivorans TaxID=2931382 RepID=UPI0020BF8689|nr:anti-virulence regulator CigR family protein [Pseudomonas sp. PIA16]MDE1167482.1 anti-virulence regulator CigR family protein [Pseudomonas sp.]